MIARICEDDDTIGQAYNCANHVAVTYDEYIRAFADALGKPVNIVHIPTDFMFSLCRQEVKDSILGELARFNLYFSVDKFRGLRLARPPVDRLAAHDVAVEQDLARVVAGEALSYGTMPRKGENEIAITPSLAKKFTADIQSLLGQTVILSANDKDYSLTISGIYNAAADQV